MPTIELTEEQIRANQALHTALQKIVAHPEARQLLQKARKVVEPDAVIPELEQRTYADTTVSELKKTVDDFIKAQTEERQAQKEAAEKASVESRMNDGFARLMQQGVTPEGIEGVKKIMAEEGILNPEIAWAHFERLNPQPAPVLPNGTGGWNFPQMVSESNDDIKKLIESRGENPAILDKMARDALNEVRGTPRR